MPSSRVSRRSSLFDPAGPDCRWAPVLREVRPGRRAPSDGNQSLQERHGGASLRGATLAEKTVSSATGKGSETQKPNKANEDNKTMGRFINRSSSFRSIDGRRCFIGERRREGNDGNEGNHENESNEGGLVDSRPPGEDISDHILVKHRHDQKG